MDNLVLYIFYRGSIMTITITIIDDIDADIFTVNLSGEYWRVIAERIITQPWKVNPDTMEVIESRRVMRHRDFIAVINEIAWSD